MILKFHDIATRIKEKLERVLSAINMKRRQLSIGKEPQERLVDMNDDDEDEISVSTQFPLTQKNKLNELQQHFERYVNTFPVFGFNSAKYDLNLIKAYLIPLLVNEREIEPTVIKRAKQYISFKFGNVQFLDIMNFLGGATSLDSFLKAYKTTETKGFFSCTNGLIVPKNSRIRHFHRTTSFSADYVIGTRWIKPTLIIKVSSTLDAAVKKR